MIAGKRLADDSIYLSEDRYEQPKEYFKLIADRIESNHKIVNGSLLDVGCATGEFIYYLKKRFSFLKFIGIDKSLAMIEKARSKNPDAEFFVESVLNRNFFEETKYDYVTCCGMASIFDEIEPILNNLLACAKKSGHIFIFTLFNDEPVDVIMRYRLSKDRPNAEWQTGWNIFSKETCEGILQRSGVCQTWNWIDFKIPFPLPKREDPMRTWTIMTKDNPFQLVNGACQLVNLKALEITLK